MQGLRLTVWDLGFRGHFSIRSKDYTTQGHSGIYCVSENQMENAIMKSELGL